MASGLKSTGAPSDNLTMRWWSLLLLALPGLAFTKADRTLPRGNDHFRLAMTWAQVDSAVAARGLRVISSSHKHLACAGDDPGVEFEQYAFSPTAAGPGLLWRVTVAYRVPYRRADFDSLRDVLVGMLGEPAQVGLPDEPRSEEVHKLTWVDVFTSVQLAARWREPQDPRSDRMLVTWTDRRLQKMVEVQRRGEGRRSKR